jgi:Flp pilus assembly pilin Flp
MLFVSRSLSATFRGNRLSALLKDTAGDILAESALVLVLVAIIAIPVLQALGVNISDVFQRAVDAL